MSIGLRLVWVIGLLVFGLSAHSLDNQDKSAAFYYGADIPWVELSLFDYAVIEAENAEQVPQENSVYAYVSVGEVLPSRSYFSAIKKHWMVAENKAWKAHVLDQSLPELHDAYIEHVITPLRL